MSSSRPQGTDYRAAWVQPDGTAVAGAAAGVELVRQRNTSGQQRFPDYSSYLRYQRGRVEIQRRAALRAMIAGGGGGGGGTPSGNVYTSPTTTNNVSTDIQSPFIGGGNAYSFDGSTSYLTLPGDDSWAFGIGDFTIEWFQYQTDSNPYPRIFTIGDYGSSTISIACSIEGGSFYAWTNGNTNFGNDANPYKNQWVHFAIVRQSGNLSVYKDGNLFGGPLSVTDNITNNTMTLYIGIETPSDSNTSFGGYLTNIRIVKGLAVYTDAFTVPTSALTITASANPYGGSNTVAIPNGYTKLLLVP